jgi:hypothetical protein
MMKYLLVVCVAFAIVCAQADVTIPLLAEKGLPQSNVLNPQSIFWYRFDVPRVENWKGDITLRSGESCSLVGLLVSPKPRVEMAFFSDSSSSCTKVWSIDKSKFPVRRRPLQNPSINFFRGESTFKCQLFTHPLVCCYGIPQLKIDQVFIGVKSSSDRKMPFILDAVGAST